jgi:hypothetical protein
MGPCLCGDTDCPTCGTAQGTREPRRKGPVQRLRDAGGVAFPCAHEGGQLGMTLRDYFAAKAMAVWMIKLMADGEVYESDIARWAYKQADAMLAEREQ